MKNIDWKVVSKSLGLTLFFCGIGVGVMLLALLVNKWVMAGLLFGVMWYSLYRLHKD